MNLLESMLADRKEKLRNLNLKARTWLRANPTATETTARTALRTYLANQGWPSFADQIFDGLVAAHGGTFAALKASAAAGSTETDSIAAANDEDGIEQTTGEVWHRRYTDLPTTGNTAPSDMTYSETRETTEGPTCGFVIERQWSSASCGVTVRQTVTNTYDGTRVIVVPAKPEVV